MVQEQCLRIARCNFTMQWMDGEKTLIIDSRMVSGTEMWSASSDSWVENIELSESFLDNLIEHAVPLDKRALPLLSGNSLGLDLYAFLAYRLPKISNDTHISWQSLQKQMGSDYTSYHKFAQKVREALVNVKIAYSDANFEITRTGIILQPSKPSVPRVMVNGFTLMSSERTD